MTSDRQRVLSAIRDEVARTGEITAKVLRLYCEHRISYAELRQAVDEGRRRARVTTDRGTTRS